MTLCSACDEFHANDESGFCSVCANQEKAQSGDKNINHNLLPMKESDINEWIDTGVHSKLHLSECSVCVEKKELINNYCCECLPSTCKSCNEKTSFCPQCNMGKYRRISHEEIVMLLENEFNPRSILKVLRESMTALGTRRFDFRQLICKSEDIQKAAEELHMLGKNETSYTNQLHTIYCLAVDLWNIQPTFVACQKGFGLEGICKNYRTIIHMRLHCDHYSFMSRRVPAR